MAGIQLIDRPRMEHWKRGGVLAPTPFLAALSSSRSLLVCPSLRRSVGPLVGWSVRPPWKIATPINCRSHNLVYMIEFTKDRCKEKYIGETDRTIKDRISEHVGYIRTKNTSQATGHHFNLPGHCLSDMKVTGLEKVLKPDSEYR